VSDLFALLGVATRALEAQRYGLDVTGQNIANVNTPGYTHRAVQLAEVPPPDPHSSGGGVIVQGVRAARAALVEVRLQQEQSSLTRESTIADSLAVVQSALGQPGASLDAALATFYNTYGALAQNPASSVNRQQVVVEGQALARGFRDLSSRLGAAQREADTGIRDAIEQVNALAKQIAELNGAMVGAPPEYADTLRDQQSVLLASLADLVDINVAQRNDGAVDVSTGNGRALVVGANTYTLSAHVVPPQGLAAIVTQGAAVPTDITAEITGGRIGALLQVRDVQVPTYIDRLDSLAYSVASDVNTLTRGGYDLAGTSGVDFFVQPSAVAGAAGLMAVTGAVAADTSKVVAAGAPTAGNNDVARVIAALQDTAMTGGTARPVDAWADLVYRVAADARTAIDGRDGHDQVAQQLKNLRDQVSGVSLDEEAAMLMKFQRAYEANAKFFSVTNDTLDVLMQMVRS
jgi:flagellar hook-associated protein 1 FlgK